jgi:hypothetical protein
MNEGQRRSVVLLLVGSALAGCASLFGIDDIPEKTGPAAAGQGASGKGGSGMAGADDDAQGAHAGRSNSGGAGAAGEPSSPGGSRNSGGTDAVGTSGAGDAGAPAGGGGEGGARTREGTPISGTVIDPWGHPLAGVPVALGDVTTVTTDTGAFTFANVPDTYDLSLYVHWLTPAGSYGWIYQGLTRRDPTLQVYRGTTTRDVELRITQTGGNFTPDSVWLLALASANGSWLQASGANGVQFAPPWDGPSDNTWSIHSLLFEAGDDAVPTAYTAYRQTTRSVSVGDPLQYLSLDMSATSPDSGQVSGSVDDGGSGDHENYAFVRFASGASLPVVNGVETTSSPFNYLVPELPDGSITLAASNGTENLGEFSIVHLNGLAPGSAGVALEIPAPAAQLSPVQGAQNVSTATSFEFTSGQRDVGAFVVKILDTGPFRGIYVVTSKTRFSLSELPAIPNSFELDPGELHGWQVETHGKPANVDAMCGPGGFIDEFAESTQSPTPSHGSGSYTASKGAEFTTAP